MKLFLVAALGMFGVLVRYGCDQFAQRNFSIHSHYVTFAINIVGCLLIGFAAEFGYSKQLISPALTAGIIVGFLGGFTTFSSFCLESVRLLETGSYGAAALYLTLSPTLGTMATFCGLTLARAALSLAGPT
jgi:CrcB protein